MEFEVGALPLRERYKLLCGLVVPRPIAFVTTTNSAGIVNAAPFSFFNVVSHDPPLVVIGLDSREDGTPKDTLANIRENGEFVVNLVSEGLGAQMNACGQDLAPGVSEIEHAGLKTQPSRMIGVPRIVNSPAALECRVNRLMEFGERGQRTIIIGDILQASVAEGLVNEDFYVNQEGMNLIGRMAGSDYTRTNERFRIEALHYSSWQR